jgi:hypothetical protein
MFSFFSKIQPAETRWYRVTIEAVGDRIETAFVGCVQVDGIEKGKVLYAANAHVEGEELENVLALLANYEVNNNGAA